MPLLRLEHCLVLTDDLAATRDFYCGILGLHVGPRPPLGFAGDWLYLGDVPCVHTAEWESYREHSESVGISVSKRAPGTGPLDHVAFNGDNYDELRSRLQDHGLPFHPHDSLAIGLRQIFLEDPNGLKLELNFWSRR